MPIPTAFSFCDSSDDGEETEFYRRHLMAAQEQPQSGPIVSQLQITPEPEIVPQHHERIHHYVIAGAVGTIIGFMLSIVVRKLRN